ncbi:hypothetical protein [Aliikangiella sp. IMCC44359]|uniref:hypothetical protein n=1 Tax=Aliikangiella sp. IMCC44359 TaxID=3459125 RepID=UPI00403A98A7
MSDLPATLTYFGSLQNVSQVLNKCALPLYEAHQLCNPFLPDKNTSLAFSIQDFFDNSVKYIAHAILGKSAPKGQPNHPLIKAIMRWRLENRFNDETEIKEALSGLLPAMVEKTFKDAKDCHQAWIDYVSTKRVTVLYEKYQELALWERVLFQHKGAAIKFKCPEGSIFEHCMPVKYQKKTVNTVEQMDYVEQMVGVKPEIEFNPKDILLAQNYALRNFKEWRLIFDINNTKEPVENIKFPVGLIQSVYIGALVPEPAVEQLKNHLARMNPKIHVYQVKCKLNEYELDFEKISEHVEETTESTETG